jgi:hypothetical protein
MSMTPNTPNLGQAIKSFWDKPEGTTGRVVLALLGAGALGAFVFFWGTIVPFVLATVQNTVMLAAWIAGTIATFFVLTNWRTSMLFKLGMRWITSWFMTLDPIGILKNMIVELKQRLEKLQKHVANLAGVKQQLKENILNNEEAIKVAFKKAQVAREKAAAESDPLVKQRLLFSAQENMDQYTDLTRDTKELNALFTQVELLYGILERMKMATQYYINQRENKVKNAEKKYKAVNSAFSAMTAAKGAIQGDANQQAFYEETFQYLADDASMKLGAIDDFAILTEQYLTDIDITRGAANMDVLKELEKASLKLLPSSTSIEFAETIPEKAREAIPVGVTSGKGNSYDQTFGS